MSYKRRAERDEGWMSHPLASKGRREMPEPPRRGRQAREGEAPPPATVPIPSPPTSGPHLLVAAPGTQEVPIVHWNLGWGHARSTEQRSQMARGMQSSLEGKAWRGRAWPHSTVSLSSSRTFSASLQGEGLGHQSHLSSPACSGNLPGPHPHLSQPGDSFCPTGESHMLLLGI